MKLSEVKLTQYSHGAGCGCKISPKVLTSILKEHQTGPVFPSLLVGNTDRDDAAVVDLGDGTAIISTTDFFMPIVDDPVDFGRIAAVNAISDIYAMGGTPILAIAILGWPVNTLDAKVANKVIEGGRRACAEAQIPLAGGHSIDSPEPIFGLAVTGKIKKAHLKKNGGAKAGDLLYLTKPLGVGILSTAQKKGKLRTADQTLARDSMVQLNSIGMKLAQMESVHAMTDVTGFGLLGHLQELCAASKVGATISFDMVPLLDEAAIHHYLDENCVPGGTHRNWESYGEHIKLTDDRQKLILGDPQTSGGLLIAVNPSKKAIFESEMAQSGLQLKPIGQIVPKEQEHFIEVK